MTPANSGHRGEDTYDVVVLGAGPVGQTAAERARAAGLTVAVVERELVGGEYSYWGCIPSKASFPAARNRCRSVSTVVSPGE